MLQSAPLKRRSIFVMLHGTASEKTAVLIPLSFRAYQPVWACACFKIKG
jgi:hypothetical protein